MATSLQERGWTFSTNHAHGLVCLAPDTDPRLRALALEIGITERAAQRIVRDLAAAGCITCERHGRRNRYTLHLERSLRHRLEAHRSIGDVIAALDAEPKDTESPHPSSRERSRV